MGDTGLHLLVRRLPDPDDLEFTLAVADNVALAIRNLAKQQELAENLNQTRSEILELRKEVQGLQGDVQFYRSEQTAAVETMAGVMDTLGQLQRPLGELYRRMQTAHPIGAEMKV